METPAFEKFAISLDRFGIWGMKWKVEDDFTAVNLLKYRMPIEKFQSRITALNNEIATTYARAAYHRRFLYVSLAIMALAVIAVSIVETPIVWATGAAAVAGFAFLDRPEEVVQRFAAEDVNWVFKKQEYYVQSSGSNNGVRRRFWIEVQVWNGNVRLTE
ncbi:hypothetical protein BJ742DRAFT_769012 [Cladochytrium replicatum]|nr:hypothetical protein BJ742DRAFT_769012 [Cladochytrium replicatum]